MAAAVRSRSRYVIAEQRLRAVVRGQDRGQSATAALKAYRRSGGRMGDRQWRALWREVQARPELAAGIASGPRRGERKVHRPGGYLYHVQLIVVDRKTGEGFPMWFAVKTPRRVRPARAVAEAAGMFERIRDARGYGYVLLGGYVSSIEELR